MFLYFIFVCRMTMTLCIFAGGRRRTRKTNIAFLRVALRYSKNGLAVCVWFQKGRKCTRKISEILEPRLYTRTEYNWSHAIWLFYIWKAKRGWGSFIVVCIWTDSIFAKHTIIWSYSEREQTVQYKWIYMLKWDCSAFRTGLEMEQGMVLIRLARASKELPPAGCWF